MSLFYGNPQERQQYERSVFGDHHGPWMGFNNVFGRQVSDSSPDSFVTPGHGRKYHLKRRKQRNLVNLREELADAVEDDNLEVAQHVAAKLRREQEELLQMSRSQSTVALVEDTNRAIENMPSEAEFESARKVRETCEKAKGAVDQIPEMVARAKDLAEALKDLQQQFLNIDSDIMESIMDLDDLQTEGPRAREMKRSSTRYLNQRLGYLDDSLRELKDLKLETMFHSHA